MPAAQAAGYRLLQQMLELHAVRNLGERVITREIANAPFGALAIRDISRRKYVALELRVIACDLRAAQGHRNRLTLARAHRGFARLMRGLQQVEAFALALGEHRGDAAAQDLLLRIAQHLARRGVGDPGPDRKS